MTTIMNQIDSKELLDYFRSCTQLYFVKIDHHGLTELQHNEKINILKKNLLEEGIKFLNKDLAMEGSVQDISERFIRIHRWNVWNETIRGEPEFEDSQYHMLNFLFSFQSETFRNELLTFKVGDYVKITGNIYYFINGDGGSKIGVQKKEYSDIEEKYRNILSDHNGSYMKKYCVYLDLISIEKSTRPASDTSSKGCFIATACYGNYDAPEVLILRNFRDKVMLNSKIGSIAVSFYYLISPHIAKLLAKSERMKTFVRRNILFPIICMINLKQK